jgi:hypothetical protein
VAVPVLSTFFGIVVRVYFEDHAPPHIHVEYAEHRAVVDIVTGKLLGGSLPKRCARWWKNGAPRILRSFGRRGMLFKVASYPNASSL